MKIDKNKNNQEISNFDTKFLTSIPFGGLFGMYICVYDVSSSVQSEIERGGEMQQETSSLDILSMHVKKADIRRVHLYAK